MPRSPSPAVWVMLSGREATHAAEVGIMPSLRSLVWRAVLQPYLPCSLLRDDSVPTWLGPAGASPSKQMAEGGQS